MGTWPPFVVWTLCGDTSGEWVEWRYPMGTAIRRTQYVWFRRTLPAGV